MTAIKTEKSRLSKIDVLNTDSKVLSSKGCGLGHPLFIKKMTRAPTLHTRMNEATKNNIFRRSGATEGSVFQAINPNPVADMTVAVPIPKTCHLIPLEVVTAAHKSGLLSPHALIKKQPSLMNPLGLLLTGFMVQF
jgi:hypothetical protein